MIAEQKDNDVIFTDGTGKTGVLKDCNAIKLFNTLFNKPTDNKYSVEEMERWGFFLR